MLVCPICKTKLNKCDKSFICDNNHCFDISKKGYVNLLLSQSRGKVHGDDKLMTEGRKAFLSKGFYSELKNLLCVKTQNMKSIVDVGCGEGYYTCGIYDYHNSNAFVYGFDISKSIIDAAASRGKGKNLIFAVANCSKLPLSDESVDCAVSVFAPVNPPEIKRVLKNDGIILRVTPGIEHLIELKKAVYDLPRFNDSIDLSLDGFSILSNEKLKYSFVCENEDLKNLFSMTPYYYKTSDADKAKLDNITSLEITAEFVITTYKKEDC